MKKRTNLTLADQPSSAYDDGNIPAIDLPHSDDSVKPAEPLPESTRPRKDGPGGEVGK
ncbi:MAG: AE-binding protein [Lachnospiraceae bacterium]|nr:AE-binding protein [Lachnospiraceae bacterium]